MLNVMKETLHHCFGKVIIAADRNYFGISEKNKFIQNIFPENTPDLGDGVTSSLKNNATYHSKHPGSHQWFPFKLVLTSAHS
jgi:hypothetical protein